MADICVTSTDMKTSNDMPPSAVERIKTGSDYLRGTLAESLEDSITGAIRADDTHISKFHGIYQQDDRDLRSERRKQKLEPAYSFMLRVRVPGGVVSSRQWLALDDLATTHANDTLRITTRQAVQYHGVIKRQLKETVAKINAALVDTLAACGDVNRNVMCTATPELTNSHAQALKTAQQISDHLTPQTTAYHEIWLDGKKLEGATDNVEPIYGKSYLPRKFKIAVAVPPQNDVDVFTNDLGFIAITANDSVVGYNVAVGGGMGMTHGDPATYPRTASIIGFCTPDQVLRVATAVVTTQRDFGNRSERKNARLKYTIDRYGLEWFREQVEERAGITLSKERNYRFVANGDRYGWSRAAENHWHLTLYVENGRVNDTAAKTLKTGLREIAETHPGEFRLTGNQNIVIANVADSDKQHIESLARRHGLMAASHHALGLASMACVGFPTCGLAMAESERYLPELLDHIHHRLEHHGLGDEAITTRMTGCPNGCARPYVAEIGLVGKAPGRYNLYLGGSRIGDRVNSLYRENVDEAQILSSLDELFASYAQQKQNFSGFGDFVIGAQIVEESRPHG